MALATMRAERYTQFSALAAQGMKQSEIARSCGVGRSLVSEVLLDPTGVKKKARRAAYGGTCGVCGARTHGANGRRRAPTICRTCINARRFDERQWTREAVVAAIQAWAAEYGDPPSASDWRKAGTTPRGTRHPAMGSVYKTKKWPNAPFVYWADAIEAAGFPRPHHGTRKRVAA